jgi:hypothetical protein
MSNVILKIFRGKTYLPYRLPLWDSIEAPRDSERLLAFLEVYNNDMDREELSALFKNDKLTSYVVFKKGNELLFLTLREFIRVNNIHINIGYEDD